MNYAPRNGNSKRFQLFRAAFDILTAAYICRDTSRVADGRLLTGFQHMWSYETLSQNARAEIAIFLGLGGSAPFGYLLLGYRRQRWAQRVGIQSFVIGLSSLRIVGVVGSHYPGFIELMSGAPTIDDLCNSATSA